MNEVVLEYVKDYHQYFVRIWLLAIVIYGVYNFIISFLSNSEFSKIPEGDSLLNKFLVIVQLLSFLHNIILFIYLYINNLDHIYIPDYGRMKDKEVSVLRNIYWSFFYNILFLAFFYQPLYALYKNVRKS